MEDEGRDLIGVCSVEGDYAAQGVANLSKNGSVLLSGSVERPNEAGEPDVMVVHKQEDIVPTALGNDSCQPQHENIDSDAYPAVQAGLGTVTRVVHRSGRWLTRARGRAWCRRLGMSADAWKEWSKLHVNPVVAMCYFYGFEAGQLAVSIYILSALPINQSVYCYIVTIPWMVNIVYCSVLDLALWRWGPVVVHHKVYPVFYLLSLALFMPLICVAYLGPLSSVPWNNRLHFVFANGVGNFCFIQTGATKTPREHPKVPRSSLLQPFSRAAINTMLIMDAWTDLTLVRSFVDRKADGCWWFGEPGHCSTWNVLIGTLFTCAVLDFTLVSCILILGTAADNAAQGKHMQRLNLALEVSCLLCELGIVVCTLLDIFSLNHPNNPQGAGSTTRADLATAFGSLLFTLAGMAFVLTRASHVLRVAQQISQGATLFSQVGTTALHQHPASHVAVVPLPEDDQTERTETSKLEQPLVR